MLFNMKYKCNERRNIFNISGTQEHVAGTFKIQENCTCKIKVVKQEDVAWKFSGDSSISAGSRQVLEHKNLQNMQR